MDATDQKTDDQIMESLLISSEDEGAPDAQDAEDAVETHEADEGADDIARDGDDVDDGGDDLDQDDDAELDDVATEVEDFKEPQRFTVKVDGESQEVSLDDLTRSYSGQAYIQKGMAEAAEQKKLAQTQLESLTNQQQRIAALYQQLSANGVAGQPQKPDPALASTDPIGYIEAMAAYDVQQGEFAAQQGQIQQLTAQQHQAQQDAMKAHVSEQRAILEREIPELANAETSKEILKSLADTGADYGFTKAELAEVTDARTVKVLHDAMKYRQMQKAKTTAQGKVKKARPVTRPKPAPKVNASKQKQDDLRNRIKGGDDAAFVDFLLT